MDYNKAKKGVDFSDQMSSYHSVLCRSLKWYRKLAFEILFGTSVVNSWVVYNKISKTKISITEFRKLLASELAKPRIRKESHSIPKRVAHTFIKPTGPGKKSAKCAKNVIKKYA